MPGKVKNLLKKSNLPICLSGDSVRLWANNTQDHFDKRSLGINRPVPLIMGDDEDALDPAVWRMRACVFREPGGQWGETSRDATATFSA